MQRDVNNSPSRFGEGLGERSGAMMAAVYRMPGRLELEEIPVPEIGPGEILVRIDACGICGTDLKKIEYGLQPGPRVYGHEMAGVIARSEAEGWAVGDRVALLHHVACGGCFYCERGLDSQCLEYRQTATTAGFEPAGGGLAQYVRVMDRAVRRGVLRVPNHVPLENTVFLEPLNTCLKGVRRVAGRPGDTLLLLGLGPIGLMIAWLARREGYQVVGYDPIPERRGAAVAMADVQSIEGDDIPAALRALTDGRGADAAIAATPAPAAIDTAIASVRRGGRVVLFANTRADEKASVGVGAICTGDRELVGSYSASMGLIDEVCQLIFNQEIPVSELVSHRFPIQSIDRALEVARRPAPETLKVIVRPND